MAETHVYAAGLWVLPQGPVWPGLQRLGPLPKLSPASPLPKVSRVLLALSPLVALLLWLNNASVLLSSHISELEGPPESLTAGPSQPDLRFLVTCEKVETWVDGSFRKLGLKGEEREGKLHCPELGLFFIKECRGYVEMPVGKAPVRKKGWGNPTERGSWTEWGS